MHFVIASDHAGFPVKEALVQFLSKETNITVENLGPSSETSVDYPDYAASVAKAVSEKRADAGILVCGTGIGMIVSANKFRGVRAALICDAQSARLSKEHNNANVIGFAGRPADISKTIRLFKIWLKTSYQNGRHQKRLEKITQIEDKNFRQEF